jgi:hypothetical protein
MGKAGLDHQYQEAYQAKKRHTYYSILHTVAVNNHPVVLTKKNYNLQIHVEHRYSVNELLSQRFKKNDRSQYVTSELLKM